MADLTLVSWNIKQLGITKSKNTYFQRVFKYVASLADVLLVMEVSPATSGSVLTNLLNALNTPTKNVWRGSVSPKDANSQKGDAYAIFYRTSIIKAIQFAQFPKECNYNTTTKKFTNSLFDDQRNPYNFYLSLVSKKNIDLYIYHAPEPSNQSTVVTYVSRLSEIGDLDKDYDYAIAGDFNTHQSSKSSAFEELVDDLDFEVQINANTTTPGCLPSFMLPAYANPYDNILVKNVTPSNAGLIDVVQAIYNNTSNLKTSFTGGVISFRSDALWVYKKNGSDHLPVKCDITI